MQQVKRKDSGSVDEAHNLLDIVLADKDGYKENARLTVKPKFVPSSVFEKETNPRLRITFFPSFYFDLHSNQEDLEHFKSYFDFTDLQNVKNLKKEYFQDEFDMTLFKRKTEELSKWTGMQLLKKRISDKRQKQLEKVEFVKRSLVDPNFSSRESRKKLCQKDKKLWIWLRNHQNPQKIIDQSNLFCPTDFLIENWSMILALFDKSYCDMPIHQQLSELAKIKEEFKLINETTYRTFLKKHLGVLYGSTKVAHTNCDDDKTKDERIVAVLSLLYTISSNIKVLFYDETTVTEDSFKSKVWKKIGKQNIRIERKIVHGSTKLLLLISKEEIINFWIVKKSNSEVTCSFLDESIKLLRDVDPNEPLVVFLDNARIHKTNLMRSLCKEGQVHVLFNAPNSSKTMPVEYLFEKVKREFRKRISKRKMENVGKTLFKECQKLTGTDAKIGFEKAKEWMKNAMNRPTFG